MPQGAGELAGDEYAGAPLIIGIFYNEVAGRIGYTDDVAHGIFDVEIFAAVPVEPHKLATLVITEIGILAVGLLRRDLRIDPGVVCGDAGHGFAQAQAVVVVGIRGCDAGFGERLELPAAFPCE